MSGSAFENSIKRKIYVLAAIEDSDECKRLKGIINALDSRIDEWLVCKKCYKLYGLSRYDMDKIRCGVCFNIVCNHCGTHESCKKCNWIVCMGCWVDKNTVCDECV